LKGQITDATTGLPVVGAIIELANLGISVVSDANGTYYFNSVPSGTYNIVVQAVGYIDYTGVVIVVASAIFPTLYNVQLSV
jgi:hypothetical protein